MRYLPLFLACLLLGCSNGDNGIMGVEQGVSQAEPDVELEQDNILKKAAKVPMIPLAHAMDNLQVPLVPIGKLAEFAGNQLVQESGWSLSGYGRESEDLEIKLGLVGTEIICDRADMLSDFRGSYNQRESIDIILSEDPGWMIGAYLTFRF